MQAIPLMLLNRLGGEALPEITVRLSPTKYLDPDVSAAKHIESPYPTEPVLLCIESLSPEERLGPCWPSASIITLGVFLSVG